MTPYYEADGVTIYHADCREVLPWLDPVDTVITDPVWPNAMAGLTGSDDPWGLFADAAALFPRLAQRVVVQLGVGSDPRFLAAIPEAFPFFRVCYLEYCVKANLGGKLLDGDYAYVFGRRPSTDHWPASFPGHCVSRTPPQGRERRHPCPRDEAHLDWLVRWFARGPVLDPFCGSGTTLVAAKRAGLSAIGVEIEERFCEVAAERLRQGALALTGL